MKIDAKLLRRHRACSEQVEEFEELWPKGLTIPDSARAKRACVNKALKAHLNTRWAICLLPRQLRSKVKKEIHVIEVSYRSKYDEVSHNLFENLNKIDRKKKYTRLFIATSKSGHRPSWYDEDLGKYNAERTAIYEKYNNETGSISYKEKVDTALAIMNSL